MMERVYRILLFFIHLIISVLFLIYQLVSRVRRKLKELALLILTSGEAEQLEMVKNKIVGFRKLPSHLGIVLNEETVSFSDIAKIVIWCLVLKVPHISIYDGGGIVKADHLYLYKQSVKCKEKLLKKNSSKYKLTFPREEKEAFQQETNGVINGHIIESETQVHCLSWENGRRALVEAARNICLKDIDTPSRRKDISSNLTTLTNCPDPELVVCFGSGYSLVGFSPWHIHLSEIVFQESHHNYQLCHFMEVLEKYSKCEQRFGK